MSRGAIAPACGSRAPASSRASSAPGRSAMSANQTLTAPAAVTRTDATVDFDWGGGSPAAALPVDRFSARWTGRVEALLTEAYTFYTTSDDGVRLWVNGQPVIDSW